MNILKNNFWSDLW